MNRDNHGVLALGRFAAILALSATLPACSEERDDLPLPALMWMQEEGSYWDQSSSHCMFTRIADAEWNAWQDEWCEAPKGERTLLGAISPAARAAIRRGFEDLKRAEPQGRWADACPTNRRHEFVMHEPIPMLEEPTTWTAWTVCARDKDDIANLEEPFFTIAKALLDR